MNTPFIDAVRDYSVRCKSEGHPTKLTLGSDAMRALERELAAAGITMKRIERPSSRAEPVPTLFGIEIIEAPPRDQSPRRRLGVPSYSDIIEAILR